jgi:hypothetical protein
MENESYGFSLSFDQSDAQPDASDDLVRYCGVLYDDVM